MNVCNADRRPKLLTCLHSCCSSCFAERLAAAKRENADSDVVDLEDDGPMAPDVTCPVCKATTGDKEVIDNFFVAGDDDASSDETMGDDSRLFCNSCEENATASCKCADCNEYLCAACVRAHLRVTMTKDHLITQLKTPRRSMVNYNKCQIHHGEKLR
jgi:hypothetical protein